MRCGERRGADALKHRLDPGGTSGVVKTADNELVLQPGGESTVDIAKLCPARFGGVEVRPIMVFPQG